ncbi:DUF222 domain-containing protein [Kribbella sp. NPDC050124]|uniref:HNH endonuclease signature motif containing protein n=1 Tax=Kribbella sp. NPDC050124 TaxID=3364114 RepID=UPI00379D3EC2
METLGERPVWSMSGGEMLSTLDTLEAELARLQTYRLHIIGGLETGGYAEELGAHDTARLLAFRYRINGIDARRDVRLALALPKYADVAAALPDPTVQYSAGPAEVPASGVIGADVAADGVSGADMAADGASGADMAADGASGADMAADGASGADRGAGGDGRWLLRPAQAEAIVSALERVPSTVPAEDLDVAEQQLVNLARHLSPAELRQAGKKIRDLLDTDGPEPDERKAYARESLTLSTADNGVTFRGYLANENAELLRALIHAGARPHKTVDGEPDPRPRDKRQADALTGVLTTAAAATDTGLRPHTTTARTTDTGLTPHPTTRPADDGFAPGFGAKANITVTIDLADLKAATADATGKLVYGDDLSAAAIRRLACDANVIPLVLGSNSEPLDVGRAERLVNRAMRRALNARDRGCVVCGAPPIQCDAHHVRSWIDGGPTAIDNLALLCRRHHSDLHAGHWTITITNGRVHVSRPPWADPPPLRPIDPAASNSARSHAPMPTSDPDPPGPAPSAGEQSAGEQSPPTGRWAADEHALQEAARFTILG